MHTGRQTRLKNYSVICFSGASCREEMGLERYWNLIGKSFLGVWDNENSAHREMELNSQCKFLSPKWLGRLLSRPAELKGHHQAADAYKSQRWFIARAGGADVIDALQTITGTFLALMRCECCQGSWESWIYPTILDLNSFIKWAFSRSQPPFLTFSCKRFQVYELQHDEI